MNIIFNIILPTYYKDYRFVQLGTNSAIFLLGLTAYAIVKRELFGIKVVLTTILVGLIGLLLFIDAFLLTKVLWVQVAKGVALLAFLAFGYYLIKSVIHEIKQREKIEKMAMDLEKANTELKKIDTIKTEFISIASHQLRTPLSAIKGYLSMISEGIYGKLNSKTKEKIMEVFESNERLIRLVNELLNISRIETGKLELEAKKARIERIITEVVQDLKITAEQKNLYLKFAKQKKKIPEMDIDEGKMRQALLNIIDNAIKYTDKGGISIKVEETDGDHVLIEIADTGEGLTKEEVEKMFESFSRGQAGARLHTEGAGLGLYIARKFVEMHSGEIWAESEGAGKGSRFYIKLPIKTA